MYVCYTLAYEPPADLKWVDMYYLSVKYAHILPICCRSLTAKIAGFRRIVHNIYDDPRDSPLFVSVAQIMDHIVFIRTITLVSPLGCQSVSSLT